MSGNSAERPQHEELERRSALARSGFTWICSLYFLGVVAWAFSLGGLTTANTLGDTLAGIFAPMAFFALFFALYIQQIEIRQNTNALLQQVSESKEQSSIQKQDISLRIFENRIRLLTSKTVEIMRFFDSYDTKFKFQPDWNSFSSGDYFAILVQSRLDVKDHNFQGAEFAAELIYDQAKWAKLISDFHDFKVIRQEAITRLQEVGADESLISGFTSGPTYLFAEELDIFIENHRQKLAR